jgi:hypothetical protein
MIDASMVHTLSTPWTRPVWSTTEVSGCRPIWQVPVPLGERRSARSDQGSKSIIMDAYARELFLEDVRLQAPSCKQCAGHVNAVKHAVGVVRIGEEIQPDPGWVVWSSRSETRASSGPGLHEPDRHYDSAQWRRKPILRGARRHHAHYEVDVSRNGRPVGCHGEDRLDYARGFLGARSTMPGTFPGLRVTQGQHLGRPRGTGSPDPSPGTRPSRARRRPAPVCGTAQYWPSPERHRSSADVPGRGRTRPTRSPPVARAQEGQETVPPPTRACLRGNTLGIGPGMLPGNRPRWGPIDDRPLPPSSNYCVRPAAPASFNG